MRKFLLSFLMLMMVTPGLACGPFMCAGKAHASHMAMAPGMPCHAKSDAGQAKCPMFFSDCSKVDLLGSIHVPDLKKPDTGKAFSVAWADAVPNYSFIPAGFKSIRGPPPDWPGLSQTQPSILLTTLRIRE